MNKADLKKWDQANSPETILEELRTSLTNTTPGTKVLDFKCELAMIDGLKRCMANRERSKARPEAMRLFDAMLELQDIESRVDESLTRAAGFDPEEPDTWPWCGSFYDWYDASFEWELKDPGWRPTREILVAWRELGFARCWLWPKDKKHTEAEQFFDLMKIQEG